MHRWPLEERLFVKHNYQNLGPAKVAEKLNRPIRNVKEQYKRVSKRIFGPNIKSRSHFKFPKVADIELGYIAGYLDGEGCIHCGIQKTKNGLPKMCRFAVSFSSKDLRSLERIRKVLSISWPIRKSQTKQSETQYFLEFAGRPKVMEFLSHILPHLTIKQTQAKIMLQILAQHRDQYWTLDDWKLVLKCIEANRLCTHPHHRNLIKKLKAFIENQNQHQ